MGHPKDKKKVFTVKSEMLKLPLCMSPESLGLASPGGKYRIHDFLNIYTTTLPTRHWWGGLLR